MNISNKNDDDGDDDGDDDDDDDGNDADDEFAFWRNRRWSK